MRYTRLLSIDTDTTCKDYIYTKSIYNYADYYIYLKLLL